MNFLFELAEDGNLESNLKQPAPACSAALCIVGLQDPNSFNHTRSEAVVHEGSVQKLYALGDLRRYLRESDFGAQTLEIRATESSFALASSHNPSLCILTQRRRPPIHSAEIYNLIPSRPPNPCFLTIPTPFLVLQDDQRRCRTFSMRGLLRRQPSRWL